MKAQELPLKTLILFLVIAVIVLVILFAISKQGFLGFKSAFFREAFGRIGLR